MSLATLLDALVPLWSLVALGLVLRQLGVLDEARRAAIEILLYRVLMPAFIVARLASAELDPLAVSTLLVAVVGLVGSISFVLIVFNGPLRRHVVAMSGPAYTSFLQGVVRNNIFLSVALGEAVLGSRGGELMVLALTLNIPPATMASVAALSSLGGGGEAPRQSLARAFATNPFIVSTALAIALNLSGIGLVSPLQRTLDLMSGSVLALALMAVGAGLRMPSIPHARGIIATTCVAKLMVMPVLAWLLCRALGAPPLVTSAAILFHAAPTAASSYVLATQMGGDGELMAAILSAQTILAGITIPLVILTFGVAP